MKINYKGYRKNIKEAVKAANRLLRDEQFYDSIRNLSTFDMANISPAQVADLIQQSDIQMTIAFYYSWSPRSKAYGYDDTKDPSVIRLNVWQLDRPLASLCNTMIHTCVHAVNAENPAYTFGHDTEGEVKNTAPYWIGALAQKIISGDQYVHEYMQHETSHDAVDIFECLILPVN